MEKLLSFTKATYVHLLLPFSARDMRAGELTTSQVATGLQDLNQFRQ
jgi:hypothetical protein